MFFRLHGCHNVGVIPNLFSNAHLELIVTLAGPYLTVKSPLVNYKHIWD